jgi:hypothetical protein
MGGKTTTSTNTVKIPQEVLDRYNAVNTQAQQVAQNPFQKYGTQASDFVAQFNPQQNQGIAGINTVAGMGPAYSNVENYLSPYIKNVADTTRAQMQQSQEQAQSGALGTAVQSGAFGGDRAGVAAANLANQNQMAMGSTMANIYNQGYGQAMDTSMNDMNRMLGVAGQQLGAGTQMQQTEQAGKDALINQFQQEQGFPFQVAQFLANIAMGTGALTGSTTTAVNQGSFFSDRRLKHDIKEIGKAHNGMPIYTFKYKGDPEQHTHVGFMADEVEKKNPEAVGLDPSGYKTVDYDKATQSMGGGVHARHAGEAFADGGVAGPYGSKVGQGVGAGSYIPDAYLPVGELMVADPTMAAQKTQGVADIMEAAANTGKSLTQLDESFGPDGKFYKIFDKKKAYGGGVQPEEHGDYLSSTLASQEQNKQKPQLQTAAPSQAPESGFGNVMNTLGNAAAITTAAPKVAAFAAKVLPFLSDRRAKHDIKEIGKSHNGLPIYTFKYKGDDREQTHVGFMADEVEKKHPEAVGERNGMKTVDYSQAHKFASGGVAGDRYGYALDGAVMTPEQEMARRRLLTADVPAVQTLGSLPDATVQRANTAPAIPVTTAAPILTQGLGGADAYREAATRRFEDTPSVTSSPRPLPRPEGLAAAAAPQVPAAQPEGLAAASVRPMPRPEGLEQVASDYEAAREHYRTKVVPTESGGRQFDPETGLPLTSPKGAVGAGQVMEATGPEAAALAGVEWDRDRWLNDEDYNLKIGEAYYLDQYRKFGSLDKADAAYNFGPTALRAAINKAAETGNSYFNELPAETQQYLIKNGTMPDVTGGAGENRITMSSRGEDQPAGGVKPYEDRNTLGKIVYNEDGTVNRDAMLSLFAGLGDMLSSPSPFLLPSIGAGLSGAANTYMAREGQVTNMQNTRLDMMKKASDEAIRYNVKYRTNFTPQEYMDMALNINRPPPEGATGTGTTPIESFNGIPLDPLGRNMSDKIKLPNGQYIEAGNSLEYLTALKNAISEYTAIGGVLDADFLQSINDRITNVTTNRGMVSGYLEDGVTPARVQDPFVMSQEAARIGADATLASNTQYVQDGQGFYANAPEANANLDRMADNLMKFDPGTLTPTKANLTSLLSSMFPEKGSTWATEILGPAGTDAAAYQLFQKEAATFLRNELNQTTGSDTAPASVLNMLGDLVPGATMNPKAIYGLLLYSKASLDRKQKYYSARDPESPDNFYRFTQDFNRENPMEASVKNAMLEMMPQTYVAKVKAVPGNENISNEEIQKKWLELPVESQGSFFVPSVPPPVQPPVQPPVSPSGG